MYGRGLWHLAPHCSLPVHRLSHAVCFTYPQRRSADNHPLRSRIRVFPDIHRPYDYDDEIDQYMIDPSP